MDKVLESLKKMGLNEKESLTYITLLKIGKTTVTELSKKSGLKRPTLYLILEELRLKGLILKIPYKKGQLFFAKNPEDFLYERKKSLLNFESLLPTILSMAKKNSGSKILLFEGFDGLKKAQEYRLDELNNMTFYGFYSHVAPFYDEETLKYIDKMLMVHKKKNITRKGFVPDHESIDIYENNHEFPMELKRLPFEKYSSDVAIEIRGDFILMSSAKDWQFIIIENSGFVKTLKQIFDLLWELT